VVTAMTSSRDRARSPADAVTLASRSRIFASRAAPIRKPRDRPTRGASVAGNRTCRAARTVRAAHVRSPYSGRIATRLTLGAGRPT
jgi:hypothetical protein